MQYYEQNIITSDSYFELHFDTCDYLLYSNNNTNERRTHRARHRTDRNNRNIGDRREGGGGVEIPAPQPESATGGQTDRGRILGDAARTLGTGVESGGQGFEPGCGILAPDGIPHGIGQGVGRGARAAALCALCLGGDTK